MASSRLLIPVSPLALSPQRTDGPLGAVDGEALLLRKAGLDRTSMHTKRKYRLGPRMYAVCITVTILYLAVRTWRSYDALRQLREYDPPAASETDDALPQSIKVFAVETANEAKHRVTLHRKEPNCRRQYWHKSSNGRWIAGPKESWIADPGTPCGEDDDPLGSPPRKPQCPDTSSLLLVLLTSSTSLTSHLTNYLAQSPCISPTTSLAIYSTAPDSITIPYPHTDCVSCNARVVVSIHDSIALAAANGTLPPAVTRLHDTLLQHQAHGLSTHHFEAHKAFAELQKHRLLPALLHAYRTHPQQKWFVVAKSSVHISMRSIAAWTKNLKMKGPVYAGAEMMYEGREFAPLDAGIILNREAVGRIVRYGSWDVLPVLPPSPPQSSRLSRGQAISRGKDKEKAAKVQDKREVPPRLRDRETYMKKWYTDLAASPHADVALASMLRDIGVNLTRSHPLMRASNMHDIEWTPDTWCKAVLMWGKVDDAQHEMLAKAERNIAQARRKPPLERRGYRNASTPSTQNEAITYSEIFQHALLPKLAASPSLWSWDNGAGDLEFYEGKGDFHHAAKSFNSESACMSACGLAPDCLQWRWEPGRCRLGKTMRMGRSIVDADDKVRHEWNGVRQGIVSGWMGHRIGEMVKTWDRGCWNSTVF